MSKSCSIPTFGVLKVTHKHKTSKTWRNDFEYVRQVKRESSGGVGVGGWTTSFDHKA